jgi:hypothetical protein
MLDGGSEAISSSPPPRHDVCVCAKGVGSGSGSECVKKRGNYTGKFRGDGKKQQDMCGR